MSNPAVIVFEGVDFERGRIGVLEGVNLEISEGERLAIVGPNGGGKTTLLRLMLGLERPTKGRVRVFGKRPEHSRRRMGYLPQWIRFDPLFPITIREVVGMGRLNGFSKGVGRARDAELIREALEAVEMGDRGNAQFSRLSGGERQRVLIARAIATEPDFLLLDEPTAMVDAVVESRLFENLRDLRGGIGLIMVSHDFGFVSQLVDSVVCVNRRVVHHPTSRISGEIIKDIYGSERVMVRHDQRCAAEGHDHV